VKPTTVPCGSASKFGHLCDVSNASIGEMATATLGDNTGASIGQALVSFSSDGLFPEEDVSSLTLTSDALPGAIRALAEKKANLEVCHPSTVLPLSLASP